MKLNLPERALSPLRSTQNPWYTKRYKALLISLTLSLPILALMAGAALAAHQYGIF